MDRLLTYAPVPRSWMEQRLPLALGMVERDVSPELIQMVHTVFPPESEAAARIRPALQRAFPEIQLETLPNWMSAFQAVCLKIRRILGENQELEPFLSSSQAADLLH